MPKDKTTRLLFGCGLVALLGASGVWAGRAVLRREPTKTDATELARVGRRDLSAAIKATGIIRPVVGAEVKVGALASGVVKRLTVQIGDTVTKGQLLAEIETEELEARRGQATAALKSARINLRFSRTEYARTKELFDRQSIPQNELERSERAVALGEAAVAEAEASLALVRAQLSRTRLFAPIGGVVASISTQQGETVASNFTAPTFLTILDLNRLEVWAYVDETDIGRVQRGQEARFSVDAYPDKEFEGRVLAIYPKAEIRDNVVNYVVVLSFTPPQEQTLRPEMTTTVKILVNAREKALTLPKRALRREGGRPYVLRPQGPAVARQWVVTGSHDEGYWEILEGLQEGDQVVIGETSENESRATETRKEP